MTEKQPNSPLHGLTLEKILTDLVAHYGWEEMGHRISIKCFNEEPSVKSSLKFLRRTDWARAKVERLYLKMVKKSGSKLTTKVRIRTDAGRVAPATKRTDGPSEKYQW